MKISRHPEHSEGSPRIFHIASLHPTFLETYFNLGVCKAAREKNIAQFHAMQLRDFAVDKHGTVDERPYGGGDSMVLRPEPLADVVAHVRAKMPEKKSLRVIYTAPGYTPWTHAHAEKFAAEQDSEFLFICGRFAGVDQRFLDKYVDEIFSVGDFVVSGGELPVLMIIDSIVRQMPGVLGNSESARQDSFASGLGGMVEYPLFTRPQAFEGQDVPGVLLSGDHRAIEQWRKSALRSFKS